MSIPLLNRRRARVEVPADHLPLTVRQVVRNLVVTDRKVWAGYRVAPQPWSFRSAEEQAHIAEQIADRWARLAGHTVRERVLPVPVDVQEWAATLSANRATPLPDVHTCDRSLSRRELFDGKCGCMTWSALLDLMQRRIASGSMDDSVTFRFVDVQDVGPGDDVRGDILSGRVACAGSRARDAERVVADLVAGPGWGAQRMSTAEVEWLLHRSIAPGLPAPKPNELRHRDGWGVDDMHQFTDGVARDTEPFDRTTRVTAVRDGRLVTRHVAVLTVGRMDGFTYPERGYEPWMAWSERAVDRAGRSFPVEWSATYRIMGAAELKTRVRRDLDQARSNAAAYREVGEEPPGEILDLPDQAARIYDELTTGASTQRVRADGPVRLLVDGDSPEQVLERVAALTDLYAGPEMRTELVHPRAQYALTRELTIGEPVLPKGHHKQLNLRDLAYANPATSTRIGDGRGIYYAYRAGSRRPVMHDSFYATEVGSRETNVWGIVARPGMGKSVLKDLLTYGNVMGGVRCLSNDPAGMSSRLCSIPELAPHSLAFDLLTDGEPGILNPPGLILDPRREEYGDDEARYRRALDSTVPLARQDRVVDMAFMCMDDYLHTAKVRHLIGRAANRVAWTQQSSMWDLVATLRRDGTDDAEREVADMLEQAAERSLLNLMFPPKGEATDRYSMRSAMLTVISTPGLELPPDDLPREHWTRQHQAAVPLISLQTDFTTRMAYAKPMTERLALFMDEVHEPLKLASGQALYQRLARNSSKHNLALYVCDQVPDLILRIFGEFLAGAWVGRLKTREAARAALPMLQVESDGYAEALRNLPAGCFAHLDLDGNQELIRVDADLQPRLKPYLFSDPGTRTEETL